MTDGRRYALLYGLICLGFLVTLSDADFGWVTDGQVMLDTAVSIHDFGRLRINYDYDPEGLSAEAGRSGKYGLGYSLILQAPLLIAGSVERLFGDGASNVLFPLTNLLLTAAACLVISLALRELGAGPGAGILAGLTYGFGTFAWPYISYDFSEPAQALALAACFLFTVRGVNGTGRAGLDATLAGLVLGFAVLTKASLAVAALPFAAYLYLALKDRPGGRAVLRRFLITLAACAVVLLILNHVRYGSSFEFGYGAEASQFTTPLATGLYGLLLSPGKGIIFYAPVVLLVPWALWRQRKRHRQEVLLITGVLMMHLLTVAKWWSWEGGFSWGPRLLLPVLPVAVIGAALMLDRVGTTRLIWGGCLVAGAAINLLGVLINFMVWVGVAGTGTRPVPLDISGRPQREYRMRDGVKYFPPQIAISYVPSLSPIVGHAWLLKVRYFSSPFGLDRLQGKPGGDKPVVDFGPVTLDLGRIGQGFVLSRWRDPHFWLLDRLRGREPNPIFSQPVYVTSLIRMGDAAAGSGDQESAQRCYERALEIRPDDPVAIYNLTRLQLQTGQEAAAATSAAGFLESHPDDHEMRFLLARSLDAAGDQAGAVREYRAYLKANPPSENRSIAASRLRELRSSDKQ